MRTIKRVVSSAAVLLTIGSAAGAVFFYSMQREFTFPRQHEQVAESPLARVPDAEAYRVATDSGAVDAWCLPTDPAEGGAAEVGKNA